MQSVLLIEKPQIAKISDMFALNGLVAPYLQPNRSRNRGVTYSLSIHPLHNRFHPKGAGIEEYYALSQSILGKISSTQKEQEQMSDMFAAVNLWHHLSNPKRSGTEE